MNRIIFFILSLSLCSQLYGQGFDSSGKSNLNHYHAANGVQAMPNQLIIPQDTGKSVWWNPNGSIAIKNGVFYYNNGTAYITPAAGSGGVPLSQLNDSLALYARLTALTPLATFVALADTAITKVKYADSNVFFVTPHDTLNKWLPFGTVYFRPSDSNTHKNPVTLDYYNNHLPASTDTTALSNRINLKLSSSDTPAMLSPYLRSATAATTYQPLGNYITFLDTNVLSTKAYRQKGIDSVNNTVALRVRYTDTANMLAPYLRTVNVTTYTAGTGLGLSGTNVFSVTPTQAITRLTTLTTDGYVKTSGGVGTLSSTATIPYSDITGTPTIQTTINGVTIANNTVNTVTASANTLTTTTLNPAVVTSSLTSVGTIGAGVWNGTVVGTTYGGTGASTTTSVNGTPITYGNNNSLPIGTGTVTNVIGGTNITITGTSTIQPTINISGTVAIGNGGTGTTTTTSVNTTPITYGADNTVTASANTLTTTSLNPTVINSSLTKVGTIATGVWQGTLIGTTYGGTGASTTTSVNTTPITYGVNNTITAVPTGSVSVTAGSGIAITGTTSQALSGNPAYTVTAINAGTVTSVSSGNLSPIFTASVTTSTTTPAIAYSISNASAYTVLCNTTNSSAAPVYSKVDAANMLFGTLPVANGGTNTTTTTSVNTTPIIYGADNTVTAAPTGSVNVTAGSGITITGSTSQALSGTPSYTVAVTTTSVNATAINFGSNTTVTAAANTLTTTTLNPAVVNTSITSTGTMTSGTLSTGYVIGGTTMTLGSDANYDMYYRNSSGVLTRLANGTTNQVLGATTSSAPSWVAVVNSMASSASSITYSASTGAVNGDINLAHSNTWSKPQIVTPVSLTDATTVAVDLSTSNNFNLTLAGNRTLGVPTNIVAGQKGIISVAQDITGTRTLAYSWVYGFAANTAPVLTTTKAGVDLLTYAVMYYGTATNTMTIASPCVVTWTAHGLKTGDKIQFTTTGALPTGVSASTTYYITKIDANSFDISTSLANVGTATFVNSSGSQSGTHTGTACNIFIGATLNIGQ